MIRHFFFIAIASFFVACITTLVLSPRVWYENGISMLAFALQKPEYYSENTSERFAYNKALAFAKNGDFDTAKSLLSSINTIKKNNFTRNVLELQGDVAYHQKTSTGKIISYYDKSLQIASNSRVSYKKSLLLNARSKQNNTEEQDLLDSSQVQQEKIQDIQKNRSKYLNTNPDDSAYQKEEIDRIKRALDESNYIPIKDW